MTTELWFNKYLGVVEGYAPWGSCAACEYEGPPEDFRVWHKGSARFKVLCNQCSGDTSMTMRHEGWERLE
jgi:hypothetical protein